MPMAGYHKPRGKYIVTGVDIVCSDDKGKDFTCDWGFSFEPFEFGAMSYREYADEITDLLKELAIAVPDSGFTACYLITNDSYDGCLLAEYSYKNQSLKVKITETDSAALCGCPICGEDLEEEIELKHHRHGKKYTCPECGEKFTFEETYYDEVELDITDEPSDSFTEEDEIPEDRKEEIYRSLLTMALEKAPENNDDLQEKLKKAETNYKTGDLSDSLYPVNHPVYHLAGYLLNVVGISDDELESMLMKAGASQFESDYIYEMCGMFYLL